MIQPPFYTYRRIADCAINGHNGMVFVYTFPISHTKDRRWERVELWIEGRRQTLLTEGRSI